MAFSTHRKTFAYETMAMGLYGASSSFQALMNVILDGLQFSQCLTFLNDTLVYASTIEEHLRRLEKVLKCFEGAGLTIKLVKCIFLKNTTIFLNTRVLMRG